MLALLMAIALGTIGTSAEGTTSLSVPYPSGISAGDMLVLCIAGRTSSGAVEPSATDFAGQGDFFRTSPASSNLVTAAILTKEATGSESGNLSVTTTNWTDAIGVIYRFTNDTGNWEGLECAYGEGDATDGTNGYDTTLDNFDPPDMDSGDYYASCTGLDQASGPVSVFSNVNLTSTGLTVTDISRDEIETTIGDGARFMSSRHLATAGTNISSPPQIQADIANVSGTGNCATVLLRMREAAADPGGVVDWLHYFRQYGGS
jgi:MSHA biogenesis protein MshQ